MCMYDKVSFDGTHMVNDDGKLELDRKMAFETWGSRQGLETSVVRRGQDFSRLGCSRYTSTKECPSIEQI